MSTARENQPRQLGTYGVPYQVPIRDIYQRSDKMKIASVKLSMASKSKISIYV